MIAVGLKTRLLSIAAASALPVVIALGCQQKMADQPSFKPLSASASESNGASARPPVAGTVARGHLQIDWALFTGRSVAPTPVSAQGARESTDDKTGEGGNGAASTESSRASNANPRSQSSAEVVINSELTNYTDLVDEFPIPINEHVIEHGRNRYMIYCIVCHDAAGTGRGKIVERGYTQPPSYHIDRLRNAPVGHLFRVVTLGYGSMPSYASQIPVRDRWAIIAYVRALQLSQHFPEDELPEDLRKRLSETEKSSVAGESTHASSSAEDQERSSVGGKQP